MALLSVVLPAYNEEMMIDKASECLTELLGSEHIDFELVFVDDGSRDQTWIKIEEQSRKNSAVRGVKFSRNFGKEAAIFAGLAEAGGDCVVVMD